MLKIGDIVCFSYNYSCCIPVFYQVIRTNKKSVFVRKMTKKMVTDDDGYGQSGTVAPNFEADFMSEEQRYICRTSKSGKDYITVDEHRAYLWDGKPKMYYGD